MIPLVDNTFLLEHERKKICTLLSTMYLYALQMYVMLDALADGGVYAGIPKEIGLRLIAHTMIVGI